MIAFRLFLFLVCLVRFDFVSNVGFKLDLGQTEADPDVIVRSTAIDKYAELKKGEKALLPGSLAK